MTGYRLFCGILAGFAFLCGTTAVSAESTRLAVGKTEILVEPEDGYCPIDRAHAFDNAWIDIQIRSNANMNEVFGAFLLCDELAHLRKGEPLGLSRWIILLAPTMGTAKAQPMNTMNREQFLSQMETQFKKGVELDVDSISKKVNEAAADVAGSDNIDPIKIETKNQPFLLGKTDNGVFAGLVMDVMDRNERIQVGAVIGMTLVNNHMVSANVYRNFDTPETINLLLAESSKIIDGIIAAN